MILASTTEKVTLSKDVYLPLAMRGLKLAEIWEEGTMRSLVRLCSVFGLLMAAPALGFAATGPALVVHDGTGGIEGDALGNLTAHLTTAGYTVTANVGVPAGSLATYKQIWDIRFNNTTPLSSGDITAYITYMNGGGSLFVMGENTGFATRNTSIVLLVSTAGGGALTITTPANDQTVQPPFDGPTSVTAVSFLASAGTAAAAKGKAAFITKDATNTGGGLVFPPGSLTNAATGTLIVVFDVNFLQAGAAAPLQALTNNLIGYLAVPVSVPNTDLAVAKTQSTSSPSSPSDLTYTLTVTNNGPTDATSVTLTDVLPAHTTYASNTAPAGWTVTAPAVGSGGTFTATRAALPMAAGAQVFTLTVHLAAEVAIDTAIPNTATVGCALQDTNPANNSATVTATVSVFVPTMGEWGMILMALLLVAAGAFALKHRQGGAIS